MIKGHISWAMPLSFFALFGMITLFSNAQEKTHAMPEEKKSVTTPLHRAVKKGDIKEVKRLIAAGVDINAQDENGKTVIFLAVGMKGKDLNIEIVYLLYSNGADVGPLQDDGSTPDEIPTLGPNALNSHTERAHAYGSGLREFIDLATWSERRRGWLNKRGYHPVHFSAMMFNLEEIKSYLNKGGDVNLRAKTGKTILHLVIGNGDHYSSQRAVSYGPRDHFIKLVNFLLDRGADMTTKDKDGNSPFYSLSCRFLYGDNGHYYSGDTISRKFSPCADAAKIFVKRPEFTKRDDWVIGPLIEIGDLKTVKFAIKKKVFKLGKDALSFVNPGTPKEMIVYILDNVKDVNLNPVSKYSRAKHETLLEGLVDSGSDSSLEVAKFLLEKGANVNEYPKRPSSHLTAIDLAVLDCNMDFTRLFLQYRAKFSKQRLISLVKQRLTAWYAKPGAKFTKRCKEVMNFLKSIKNSEGDIREDAQTKETKKR